VTILPRVGSNFAMARSITLFVVCVVASACASAPKPPAVAPGLTPTERMAAADALVRAGCFDCLLAAFREYDALRSVSTVGAAASGGATRTAALLAIRERDLGTFGVPDAASSTAFRR
jgi:hypothetical protein